jgi:hypothetical protein
MVALVAHARVLAKEERQRPKEKEKAEKNDPCHAFSILLWRHKRKSKYYPS